ncbi:MAG: sigma-70 family RNA polymerase sigma factor [Bacteroidaceae bacterium]|nr:sigma-70 family RNA polymerase sigma factor [Bacteroidaceae bacterium]
MNSDTFKTEVRALRPRLLATARRIMGDDEEAEDVVQDVLLRLWQLRDEPIRNVGNLAQAIVRNLCIDKVRRRPPTVSIHDIDLADPPPDHNEEQLDRMLALVGQLPTLQQTILRLRHMEGMTMKEIAELMGTTEQAVRQSLSRARRTILQQYNITPSL